MSLCNVSDLFCFIVVPLGRGDCEQLCWNLAGPGLGALPHADSPFSLSQPCSHWLHKADYRPQRIPEGSEMRRRCKGEQEPLIDIAGQPLGTIHGTTQKPSQSVRAQPRPQNPPGTGNHRDRSQSVLRAIEQCGRGTGHN
uniref:Uncharacterized protein n=1 Tax=Oncorhynchus tshawytscha TaxID=74940 RepID=A0AAZ3P2R3_ONCTS